MLRRGIVVLVAILAIFYFLGQMGRPDSSTVDGANGAAKTARAVLPSQSHHAAIAPGVYAPYSREEFPRTFSRWGSKGLKRIDRYRAKAAEQAELSSKCDYVDLAEFSESRSTPPNDIWIFVDCRNGERFYLGSADLDRGATAKSVSQKTALTTDSELQNQCEQAVINSLKFPSSYAKRWFSEVVYHAAQGNKVVTLDFTAKNGFGNDIPQQARCVLDDRGLHPPEISDR